MKLLELDFPYPENLIATERRLPSRVMWVEGETPRELQNKTELLERLRPGDLLVVNDTRVLKRRVFSRDGLEILFLKPLDPEKTKWQVLCPSSRWKPATPKTIGDEVTLELTERGRPQVVCASQPLSDEFFERFGELPLPPYIQKARDERHNRSRDKDDYQTAWAMHAGSLAAPTASLHFSQIDLEALCARGVRVEKVTLHVGLGTFLPVTAERLEDHVMHAEEASVTDETWQKIRETKERGGRVWALGTTVARTLESMALGRLAQNGDYWTGATDLFIRPGFTWQIVDVLMTNFHQPRSTLLALVASFAGLENVKRCYAWAIEREFRLFSYGDLTIWTK